MAYISESLLYICFSIVMGYFLLSLVPETSKPTIHMPKGILLTAVISIPILSYVPIHSIILQYMSAFKLGYIDMVKSILLDLPIGEAWLWTLLGSAGLSVMVGVKAFARDRHMPKVAFVLCLLLTFWLGYSSHSASINSFSGLVVHTTHFIFVSLWIGILFIVGWFATDYRNWDKFLKWFSPFAICSVVIVLLAGITLMTFTTQNYNNGLMLDYGQFLLLKHISIIPLLWLAYSNGFLYKKKFRNSLEQYSPAPMLRAESVAALVVFIFTAIMGQQAPPHNVIETLRTESPSKLFTNIYQGSFSPDLQLHFQFNMNSILLWLAALLMIYVCYLAFKLRNQWMMVVSILLFTGFGYLGYMFGLTASN